MKIPIIQNTGRAPRIGAGMAYDPSSEIAAQSAKVKSIESMVNLAEGFQQKYEEAQDQADLIKYRNASTELATKIANKKKSILLDENNTLQKEEIWDAKLQPEVDKFKSELGSLVSYRNKSKYESIFDGTASQLKLGDETDNLDRELTDFATTLGFNLENNLIAGNAEAAQATFNQMSNLVGNALPTQIAAKATHTVFDMKRQEALVEFTSDGDYEKLKTQLTNVAVQNSPFFSETDRIKNKSSSVKLINKVNEQLNAMREKSSDLIIEGIVKGDLDVSGITMQNSALPQEHLDLVINLVESQLSGIASQEVGFTAEKADIGNPVTDFLEMYQAIRKGENVNISDMFNKLIDSNNLVAKELGVLLIGDTIRDFAREGKSLSLHENRFTGKIDFLGNALANQETPMGQYAIDYFDNVLQTSYQLEGEESIKFISRKARNWTVFNKKPDRTPEDYLVFRENQLKIYNQNIIDNSSLGIGRTSTAYGRQIANEVFK